MTALRTGAFAQPMPSGVRLFVRVSPKASRDRIESIERDGAGQERLRIRVTAPADKGAANERVVALLAKALHLAPSCLAIRQGEQARNKVFDVTGDTNELMARIGALAGETE